MATPHRIFGIEMSPYSVKVRSYFRYKGIPHQWIVRNAETQAEYQKYAKLPIVPLVVTPGGEGIQDSTPILERFEAEHPEPSIHPGDPVAPSSRRCSRSSATSGATSGCSTTAGRARWISRARRGPHRARRCCRPRATSSTPA